MAASVPRPREKPPSPAAHRLQQSRKSETQWQHWIMGQVSTQQIRQETPRPIHDFDLGAIGRGLVFAQSLPELAAALEAGGAGATAVIQAPPGTGKTTLVPPLVANHITARTGVPARIVVTQPRRVAARSAARRLSSLDAGAPAKRVGFTVRGESTAGPETLVEFVTPGILLRRLLADPGLESVDAVIVDEVHERGLETDLLLGLLREVHELRGDLMLVAMSATLDAPRFAALLGSANGEGSAPVIDCPAALHPLEIVWVPAAAPRLTDRGVSRTFLSHVAATAAAAHTEALGREQGIDALVFVPGAWEVAEVAAQIRTRVQDTEVLELHGQVTPALQDRAVSGREPGGLARIIVSTSLAESSLTVPGVRLVIDSGLAREPRRDAARSMSGLVTVSASRASSIQRAGRAARQGPGTVVRCFGEKTFAAAPAHPRAEISVADLTSAALLLACWGSPGGQGLRLPEAPPVSSLEAATTVLAQLGAIDDAGHATALGRRLALIPADPRLGRALLDGTGLLGAAQAAQVVALLAGDYRAQAADLGALWTSLRQGGHPGSAAWKRETARLERFARQSAGTQRPASPAADGLGLVVALAYPAQVARRVHGASGTTYLLASGTRAGLPASSPLAHHDWIAVAEVARAAGRDAAGTGALIRAAAPLNEDTALLAAAHLNTEDTSTVYARGKLSARRVHRLGAIELSSTPVAPTRAGGRAAVLAALREQGLGMLKFSASATLLRNRLSLLHRELGAPWPAMDEASLLESAETWLAPELEALAGGKPAGSLALTDALRRLLPWPEATELDALVPERLAVPSGSLIRIDYPDVADPAAPPVVAVKLQECFGLALSPTLVRGRVPVLFHLLSPAGRPLAVTDDLASFWSGPYTQVRAENRGRYPKHPWPEDPWSAPATRHVKKRM
ncbi:ATP-dependent RNA helicase HrpB [Paeniglutamicibacter gangotriensis Lz1y]|uniref:ATP-dependent RNA helicase HrpB n=2 Tax=Paeniglutamicibacter gangotriensis TaxID=254787 RepID=M7MUB4_9MICC|nr:ATP-dependent RNA helicase HrpB [Paeniglutamicibacter gangotriensis Lz1y]